MKKYLLFDADGTLYDFKKTESIALKALLEKYGQRHSFLYTTKGIGNAGICMKMGK